MAWSRSSSWSWSGLLPDVRPDDDDDHDDDQEGGSALPGGRAYALVRPAPVVAPPVPW
jgi:hypothetical protein